MFPHVCCYNAEIICIRQCDNPFFLNVFRDTIEEVSEIVANALLIVDEINNGIECEDEDDGAHRITFENSMFERKYI